jgi:hypothetical protein
VHSEASNGRASTKDAIASGSCNTLSQRRPGVQREVSGRRQDVAARGPRATVGAVFDVHEHRDWNVLRVRAMRAPLRATLLVGYVSVVAFAPSCNALLGTTPPEPPDASAVDAAGGDVLGAPTMASDSAGDTSDSAAPDGGPDGLAAGSDGAAEAEAGPLVCPDSCPDGGCVFTTCPVRIIGGLNRLDGTFADPGTTGFVFFGDFDSNVVYYYDKAKAKLGAYPASSSSPVFTVANSTHAYWSLYGGGIGWADRSTGMTGEADDTAYGVTWASPWSIRLDTSFIYWCDRYGPDCWRMDLGLKTPTLLYRELLPDGGPSPEQFLGTIAVDPGPTGYVFFTAGGHLNRMNKDGTGLVALAPVPGQEVLGIHNGLVYWVDAAGALVSMPENNFPPCDAGTCGTVVLSAGTPYVGVPEAFDDTYGYWWANLDTTRTAIVRARLDGSSHSPEILVEHSSSPFAIAVDDVAIYYVTQNESGLPHSGSFWRQAK